LNVALLQDFTGLLDVLHTPFVLLTAMAFQ